MIRLIVGSCLAVTPAYFALCETERLLLPLLVVGPIEWSLVVD